MRLYWYEGNEAGWTDDLGIIADRNQRVPYRPQGWYLVDHSREVHEWCVAKLSSYYILTNGRWPEYYIDDEQDVMLLKLRWPL